MASPTPTPAPGTPWLTTGNAITDPATDFLGTSDAKALAFRTVNVERARIDANGNVGIGTIAPQSPLQLKSLTALSEGPTASGAWANFGSNRYYDGEWKRIDPHKAGVNLHINADDGAGQEFRFQRVEADGSNSRNIGTIGTKTSFIAEGNVGIGTISPGRALEVAAVDSNTGIKITGTTSNRSWVMAVGAAAGDGKLNIYDYGASASRLTIDTSGKVGIGNTSPAAALHVQGASDQQSTLVISRSDNHKFARLGVGSTGVTLEFDSSSYFSISNNAGIGIGATLSGTALVTVTANGNVGIGTGAPGAPLHVNGVALVQGTYATHNTLNNQGAYTISIGNGFPNYLVDMSLLSPGQLGPVLSLSNPAGGVNSAAAIDFNTFDPGRGDPFGETSPSSEIKALDVGNFANDIVFLSNRPGAPSNGLVERMRITSTGNITVPGDILLTGADCAEQFDINDSQLPAPGTVVSIDADGSLRESCEAYDKKVAGVVSGAGDYKHGILLDRRPTTENRVAVALVGKVYCKVDADYSAIQVGDLLTTSPTPGHAMRATESAKAFGATIGKALKPLAFGKGLVPILVALQ